MLIPTRNLVSIARLTAGRRIVALQQMRPVAVELNNTMLIERIDECIAHDRITRHYDSHWTGFSQQPVYSPRVLAVDNSADPAITATRDMALAQTKGRPPTHPRAVLAQRFVAEAFPLGVFAITSLPFADQAAAMEDLMERLRGPLAPVVIELGLSEQVAYLGELTAEYRAAVNEVQPTLSFDTVRAARDRGQDLFTSIVALVMALYYNPSDPIHVDAQSRLLAPVMLQDRAIRAYLSRRVAVRDVDPETGEVDAEGSEASEPGDPADSDADGEADSDTEAGTDTDSDDSVSE